MSPTPSPEAFNPREREKERERGRASFRASRVKNFTTFPPTFFSRSRIQLDIIRFIIKKPDIEIS